VTDLEIKLLTFKNKTEIDLTNVSIINIIDYIKKETIIT